LKGIEDIDQPVSTQQAAKLVGRGARELGRRRHGGCIGGYVGHDVVHVRNLHVSHIPEFIFKV
jgi:hypothetical protein